MNEYAGQPRSAASINFSIGGLVYLAVWRQ